MRFLLQHNERRSGIGPALCERPDGAAAFTCSDVANRPDCATIQTRAGITNGITATNFAAPRKPVAEALALADDEPEPAHAANATHKEKQNAPQKEKQDDRSRPVWQHSFG